MKSNFASCSLSFLKRQAFLFSLAVFFSGGCVSSYQQPAKSKPVLSRPENFLSKAGHANLIVIAVPIPSEMPDQKPINLKMLHRDAFNFIAAIRRLESGRERMRVNCAMSYKMDFYKGTNYLTSAGIGGKYFWCEDGCFSDPSGVIEGVIKICSQRRSAREREWQQKIIESEVQKQLNPKSGSTNF